MFGIYGEFIIKIPIATIVAKTNRKPSKFNRNIDLGCIEESEEWEDVG